MPRAVRLDQLCFHDDVYRDYWLHDDDCFTILHVLAHLLVFSCIWHTHTHAGEDGQDPFNAEFRRMLETLVYVKFYVSRFFTEQSFEVGVSQLFGEI